MLELVNTTDDIIIYKDKLKYPLELQKPIFTMNSSYKNLEVDKYGLYIDLSRENLIIKLRLQQNIVLNEFDNRVFLVLLHIAYKQYKEEEENPKTIHNKRISIKTTIYQIEKLLKLQHKGNNYHKIRNSIIKFSLTMITIEDKNAEYKFSAFPLIMPEIDEYGKLIANFEYNPIISKSIISIFMPRYEIFYLNNFTTNKINSILLAYYKSLNMPYKELKIETVIKKVYTLDDISYNNLTSAQQDKYLNRIIKDTKEIELIDPNIKLVLDKPKKDSKIIIQNDKKQIINKNQFKKEKK